MLDFRPFTKYQVVMLLLWPFLNMIDGLETWIGLSLGIATEVNPVQRLFLSLGYEAFLLEKLLIGAVASFVIVSGIKSGHPAAKRGFTYLLTFSNAVYFSLVFYYTICLTLFLS